MRKRWASGQIAQHPDSIKDPFEMQVVEPEQPKNKKVDSSPTPEPKAESSSSSEEEEEEEEIPEPVAAAASNKKGRRPAVVGKNK